MEANLLHQKEEEEMERTIMANAIDTKNKLMNCLNSKAAKALIVVTGALNACGLGFCTTTTIDANSSAKNFMKVLFNAIMFAGVVLIIAGAAMLIKIVVGLASGEQAQPGSIGRALGLLIGGIVAVGLKAIIKTITGTDPTTMTFF